MVQARVMEKVFSTLAICMCVIKMVLREFVHLIYIGRLHCGNSLVQ